MAYKGTNEKGEQYTGGDPSEEEERMGRERDPWSDAEVWFEDDDE